MNAWLKRETSLVNKGPKHSSTDAAMPMGHMLDPAVFCFFWGGGQSWRPLQGKGTFVPFLGAALLLESWLELGPE